MKRGKKEEREERVRGKGRERAGRQLSKVTITSNGQEGKDSPSSPQGMVYKMAIQMSSTRM